MSDQIVPDQSQADSGVINGEAKNRPQEALTELLDSFNAWTSILTSHSLNSAYALVGANWAVHGSANTIISNAWAKSSIIVILIFLGCNLVIDWRMGRLHFRQYLYAEENAQRWEMDYRNSIGKRDPWPYTTGIECLGKLLRFLKLVLPILSAIFLIVSLFYT